MTIDRFLAIVGILLAIPGVIVLFESPRKEEGYLLVALVCVVCAYAIHFYWWEFRQPPFTHLEMDKTLSFVDKDANIAMIQTSVKSRVSHSGITQLWFRNFQPGDKYQNLTIDQKPAVFSKKAGSVEFYKQFDDLLRSRQSVAAEIRYEVHNAFDLGDPNDWFMTHVVGTKTKKIKLRVIFLKDRPGKNVKSFATYGTGLDGPAKPLEVNAAGIAEYVIRRPKAGARYTIKWQW